MYPNWPDISRLVRPVPLSCLPANAHAFQWQAGIPPYAGFAAFRIPLTSGILEKRN
jgi:hypothetical protein